MARLGQRPDTEDVRGAAAVGADGAAVERVALTVVRCRGDRMLAPRVAAVVRDGHDERRGNGVALLLPAERRPAGVDGAEVRARAGIVGPDLLLVGERGRGLLADDHRGATLCARAPRGLVACRSVARAVGTRDGDRLEALERLLRTHGADACGQ